MRFLAHVVMLLVGGLLLGAVGMADASPGEVVAGVVGFVLLTLSTSLRAFEAGARGGRR